MLHPNAKQRLYRVCPREFDVGWRHPATDQWREVTIEPSIVWKDDDRPIDYPVIALEVNPETIPRQYFGEDQDKIVYKQERPDDDSIAYDRFIAKPVYGELHITVAVDSSHQGIPKHVIADVIAHDVYIEYEFNTEHLNTPGTTADGEYVEYEWPMAVFQDGQNGIVNMNQMVDEQSIQRRQIPFRVNYSMWVDEEIPATQAVEYTFGIDKDYDGEPEETTGPHRIDFYEDND